MNSQSEKKELILKERAQRIAKPIMEEKDVSHSTSMIKFKINEDVYAIDTSFVQEVYPLKELTHLPFSAPPVLGLINVRRKIFSVIDLQILFQLPNPTKGNLVLILKGNGNEFGILTSTIFGLMNLLPEDSKPPLATFTELQKEVIKAMTPEGVAIINGENLLRLNMQGLNLHG